MVLSTTKVADLFLVIMRTRAGGETQLASYHDESEAKKHADRAARNTDLVDVEHIVRVRHLYVGRLVYAVARGRGVR